LTYTSIELVMTNIWIDIINFRRWSRLSHLLISCMAFRSKPPLLEVSRQMLFKE
jgi:hypothetical protein